MPTIAPLRLDQIAEARRVIYTTAHELFYHDQILDETIQMMQEGWPLRDLDAVQSVYFENGGTFLVMIEDGRIIGTGALRRLADDERLPDDPPDVKIGEIKRLWFLPQFHGKGLGYQMMMALLDAARERGYTIIRLETSPALQPRAHAFYLRLGFHDIPRYGDDQDDVGMELRLE